MLTYEQSIERLDTQSAALRSVALNLKQFCDTTLPYGEMVETAARNAATEIKVLESQTKRDQRTIFELEEFIHTTAAANAFETRQHAETYTKAIKEKDSEIALLKTRLGMYKEET